MRRRKQDRRDRTLSSVYTKSPWLQSGVEIKNYFLLKNTNKIYLNSDAHTLFELKVVRKKAIEFLVDKWYL